MKRHIEVAVVSLFLLLFAAILQGQTYPPGMVSYWKFDEGVGTVTLDSIGTNNGAINGATYVEGIDSTALNFNGTSNYVLIPASPLRQDLTKFTIEAWVMPRVITSMDIVDNQVEDPSGMSGKIFFGLFDWGSGPSWGALLEYTRYSQWGPTLYNPTVVPVAGRWYHVATTWDGSNHVLYANGEEIARGQTWFNYLPGSYPLPIGIKLWDHNNSWNGVIDEVAFYDRALTGEEVRSRYEQHEKGAVIAPVPGSTLTGSSTTFKWAAGAATAYWLDIGNVVGGNQYYQSGNLGNILTVSVNGLPTNGATVYVTLYSLVGGQWLSNPYTYTAYNVSGAQGIITTPAPGSTLTGSSVVFTWSAGTGATAYWLDAGNVPGGNQYYQSGNLGSALTTTANGLPITGSAVYVTLYSLVGVQWLSSAYAYTAYNVAGSQGVLTTPTPGSTLTGSGVTFNWTAGAGANAYWLDVGSAAGGNQYYQSGNLGTTLTATVNGLPTDASTVYVTLYSLVGGQWVATSYTYTAFNQAGALGVMQTPSPGSVLSGNIATFTWSAGSGTTAYWLDVGSAPGGNQYYQSGNLGGALSTTVYSLPADNSTIYVTLYSYVGGQWLSDQYIYSSGP